MTAGRAERVLRTTLRSAYVAGWRRGAWQGAIAGALLVVLAVEAARRLT